MKISEVAKLFNLTVPTLRYYEEINLIEPVPRQNNIRHYNENHLDQIQFILCMKKTGMTLEEITGFVQLYLQGNETREQRRTILEQQQQAVQLQIEELRATIQYIQNKLQSLEQE